MKSTVVASRLFRGLACEVESKTDDRTATWPLAACGSVRLPVYLVIAAIIFASCGTETDSSAVDQTEAATVEASSPDADPAEGSGQQIPALPSALYDPVDNANQPAPVTISIGALDINEAPIEGVGIEDNGEMEVPGPLDVGWYAFGSTPGQAGSSVLAAHIATGGQNGVFRYLDDIEVDDIVEVAYETGAPQRFRVTRLEQFNKTELPFDDIFRRSGDPQLVLITCGGDFNPSNDSYEDNVVAFAEPLSAAEATD